ncbi:MAG: YraN family protein [Gemmatimonadales bacterium]|nr:YraN family protein [Gemmatimonadales bacterium]
MSTPRLPPDLWTDPRHRDGLEAETRAADWLVEVGWTVVARRFPMGRHDLDIVARLGTLVAFVEVKWRSGPAFGAPEEAVGGRKRRVIERVAWTWILRHGAAGDNYRFDVMALSGPLSRCQIRHIEDAWRPGWR